ncbi:MAG: DUF4143 domain-containing protein [Coprobacillus sp.]|nr:DUF4143 domain-containing protein [Coprobacillus sp.]
MENEEKIYYPRITDTLIEREMESFPGVLLAGPKYCGKSTTSTRHVATKIDFSDIELGDYYLNLVNTDIKSLFSGPTPILFDEWQLAPKIYQGVKQYGDELNKNGLYLLTGSVTRNITLTHNGAGRVSQLTMLPMSLYESKDSSGEVSLLDLIEGKEIKTCYSPLGLDDLIFLACRGGWPKSLFEEGKEAQLKVAKDLYEATKETDTTLIDDVKRKGRKLDALVKSLARNICQPVSKVTLIGDATSLSGEKMSESSFESYFDALERLFTCEKIRAWCPNIRSKSTLRASPKYNFIDPSIAVASLNLGPDYFKKDLKMFGFIFESMVIRDIKIYSSLYGGSVGYYRDKTGLECDIVLYLKDKKYALIEVKLGEDEIEMGAKNLNKLEQLIFECDTDPKKKGGIKYGAPLFKAVITGTRVAYRRDDGVYVIPLGVLKC